MSTGVKVSWITIRVPNVSVGVEVSWIEIRVPYTTVGAGSVFASAGGAFAQGIGAATARAIAEAFGTADVLGVGFANHGITAGSASGSGDAQGVGASIANAVGNADGVGTARGVNPLLFVVGGHGKPRHPGRPVVDDVNDLRDLADLWEVIMRKAA